MHTTIDYSQQPEAIKAFNALNDCINWLGWERFEKVCNNLLKDTTSTYHQKYHLLDTLDVCGWHASVMINFIESLKEMD